MRNRISIGLDVHARSVVGCALDGETGEIHRRTLTPDHGDILAWIRSLPGPVGVTYEAGPTGFGLARFLLAADVDCVVAAPISCNARSVTGSRPTRTTPCIWPVCCIWVRLFRWRSPTSQRRRPVTWSGPAKTSVVSRGHLPLAGE